MPLQNSIPNGISSCGLAYAFLCLIATITTEAQAADDFKSLSLVELEDRLAQIDQQLETLATPSFRTGVGAVGYRSLKHESEGNREWIRIDLEQPSSIDQIILVPSIWRDTKSGFRADGFPAAFEVVVGSDAEDDSGRTVATFHANTVSIQRVAPLVIRCAEDNVSWMRIEVKTLSTRAWDQMYILQLSEVLAFSGEENVALRQKVTTSSEDSPNSGSRRKEFLVDGYVPYLMDASQGEQSIAFVSETGIGEQPAFTIDLGTPYGLDRIHLHATDLSDTVPQSSPADFGIPRELTVVGALQADFADAVELCRFRAESIFETGPILTLRFPSTRCQFLRVIANQPFINELVDEPGSQIGFAEIEAFEDGVNVALNRPVTADFQPASPLRNLAAVTDGRNLYGNILPTKQWLGELSTRHDLEVIRPQVAAELTLRYQRQTANFNRLIAVAISLAIIALGTVLIGWVMRQRAVLQTREQIAADLHDELGANIHAIGLLSDLAGSAVETSDRLPSLMQRMRELTERTGMAAAHCANLLEAKDLYDDLPIEMQRASQRILADMDHDLSIDGQAHLEQLSTRRRIDLFLFYKECLINILRHSGATKVATRLVAEADQIRLTVTDNGQGLGLPPEQSTPPSLQRRTQLLGGKVEVQLPTEGGTRVCLTLQRRFSFPKSMEEARQFPNSVFQSLRSLFFAK